MNALRLAAGVVMAACVFGCRSADPSLYPPPPGGPPAEAVVLDNHWHTALIFRQADLPPSMREDLARFAGFRYLMIGWGDEGFFRAEHVTPGLVFQALFESRGSVLLVVGFDTPPESTFADGVDIYSVPISRAGRDRTAAAVSAAFRRDGGGLIDAGPGIDGGWFYAARGRYALYRTCNQWTAARLADAGLPVTPFYAATAGNLAFQLRQLHGTLKNGRPVPTPKPPDPAIVRQMHGPHS